MIKRFWNRFFARGNATSATGEPPPCVGCREQSDRLAPVDATDVAPSTGDSIIGPVAGLQVTAVEDQLIVLDPRRGQRVLLNATAALIFTAIEAPTRLDAIAARLAEEFGVDRATVTPDVTATIDRLLSQGMLTRRANGADDVPEKAVTMQASRMDAAASPVLDLTTGVIWSYDSGGRAAAGSTIVVRAEPSAVADDLQAALQALPEVDAQTAANQPVHRIDIVEGHHLNADAHEAGEPNQLTIVANGGHSVISATPQTAAARVFEQIDAVLTDLSGKLRFHAGAVERNGHVVVILGHSGHGKSTFTAALVQAGWKYLTDELVVIDPETHNVEPYARPLDLDADALANLGVAQPDLVTGGVKNKLFPSRLGQVSAGGRLALLAMLTGSVSDQSADPPGVVAPAEAVIALLPFTFISTFNDPAALDHLGKMCESVTTYRMSRAPISAMVREVENLVAPVRVDANES